MATILIADDDSDIRQALRMFLEPCSFKILEAGNGQEALQIAMQESPDLILLDWFMPGMNGRDLLAALRSHAGLSETPVIVMTGAEDAVIEVIQLGAQASIVKPFSPKEILQEVQNLLAQT
jgi:DNA-binding response OmpR family regulator